jgi:hypothetical protein
MAASRRSPGLKGHWRADTDKRPPREHGKVEHLERRARPPISFKRFEGVDLELKIKGRATADTSGPPDPHNKQGPIRDACILDIDQRTDHSPERGLRQHRRHIRTRDEFKGEKVLERIRDRKTPESAAPNNRLESLTPEHTQDRYTSTPRTQRAHDTRVQPSHRRGERTYSPTYSPREQSNFPTQKRKAAPRDRSIGDFYVPSNRRRRSQSPQTRSPYRTIHSREPYIIKDKSRDYYEDSQSERQGKRLEPKVGRERWSISATHREPSVKRSSPLDGTESKPSKRPRILGYSPNASKKEDFDLQSDTFPPLDPEDNLTMQPSTRPIQSILDDHVRHPSPPRPIPSFDDSNGSGNLDLRDTFPMHGMKVADVNPAKRRIPTHIDTRQSFNTSPQFMTPTSSHHGSPQSESPFSQGRGVWAGQQHFHGQHG